MKKKAVYLLVLAAVCTVALWPPAVSLAWDQCPGQSCPFWRDVCERNGGTFTQEPVGYCIQEDTSSTLLWDAVCTYDWRGPWYMSCTGI
jgi:hypothetical protein